MLFDPFINGVAELHDRHRDMRLDVDNMSYEVKAVQFFMNLILTILNKICNIVAGTTSIGRTYRRREHRAK